MDIIKLSKEIEKKIKKSEDYIKVILEYFKQIEEENSIKITHRIKSKIRILEKIKLWKTFSKYQNMDEVQILNKIGDIIGLTVVIEDIKNAFAMAELVKTKMEKSNQNIQCYCTTDYITNNPGITGYKALLLVFNNYDGLHFEVQITDKENLVIRDNTHSEFEAKKYKSVRIKEVDGYERK